MQSECDKNCNWTLFHVLFRICAMHRRFLRGGRRIQPQFQDEFHDNKVIFNQDILKELEQEDSLAKQSQLEEKKLSHKKQQAWLKQRSLEVRHHDAMKNYSKTSADASKRPEDPQKAYPLIRAFEDQFVREKSYKEVLRSTKDQWNFLEVTHENRHDMIRKVIEPFHHLSYKEQLDLKTQKHEEICLRIMKSSGQVT